MDTLWITDTLSLIDTLRLVDTLTMVTGTQAQPWLHGMVGPAVGALIAVVGSILVVWWRLKRERGDTKVVQEKWRWEVAFTMHQSLEMHRQGVQHFLDLTACVEEKGERPKLIIPDIHWLSEEFLMKYLYHYLEFPYATYMLLMVAKMSCAFSRDLELLNQLSADKNNVAKYMDHIRTVRKAMTRWKASLDDAVPRFAKFVETKGASESEFDPNALRLEMADILGESRPEC